MQMGSRWDPEDEENEGDNNKVQAVVVAESHSLVRTQADEEPHCRLGV
jgi:hypothetical protein